MIRDGGGAAAAGGGMIEWNEYVKFLIALLVIVDVPGNLPIFLQQTEGFGQAERRVTALTAGLVTALVLLVFALLGPELLALFGITVEAFKIIGGLVILIMALEMMGLTGNGNVGPVRSVSAPPIAVGIFPLAVPLFAGPGAISIVMVYAHKATHSNHDLIVGAVIATAALAIVVGLTAATAVSRFLGPITQSVINRLFGLIVGTMGVEFILEGAIATFPNLVG
jgi:multiple antibiotic resistance protein